MSTPTRPHSAGRHLLAAALMAQLGVAHAGCLPESVDGAWQVTRVTKWVSCLGSRCKHGSEESSDQVDFLKDPTELREYSGVQCWPDTSNLWRQAFGPYVSWNSHGNRCAAKLVDRPGFLEQLQGCAEESSLALLGFSSKVKATRGGQRVTTTAALRFSILNSAGRVAIRTATRLQWTRE